MSKEILRCGVCGWETPDLGAEQCDVCVAAGRKLRRLYLAADRRACRAAMEETLRRFREAYPKHISRELQLVYEPRWLVWRVGFAPYRGTVGAVVVDESRMDATWPQRLAWTLCHIVAGGTTSAAFPAVCKKMGVDPEEQAWRP